MRFKILNLPSSPQPSNGTFQSTPENTMNFFIGIALLLPVWATATNNTPNRARGGGGVPLQFSKQVVLDDTGRVGLLEILESQEPADAVFDFAKHHNLDLTQQHSLLDSICQSMSCTRKEALLFSVPVDFGNDKPVDFQLFQGSEPADAVDEFVKKHNLPENYHSAIMKRACNAQAVECKRLEPGKSLVHLLSAAIKHSLHHQTQSYGRRQSISITNGRLA